MTVLNDTIHTAEFILFEGDSHYSRDEGTVVAGDWVAGTVLGKVTASGKYTILAPAAADGSQNGAAVLVYGRKALPATDQKLAVLTRHATVNSLKLTWPGGITAPQKTAATAQLAALGIVVR